MKEFSYADIEAATKGFASEKLIGKGSHGRVYKGRLRSGKRIAVKTPPEKTQRQNLKFRSLECEIEILASVSSRHIVKLLGICHGSAPQRKLLVMELMPNGSLHNFLFCSPSPPSWSRRVTIALEIAQAILSLHEAAPPVIHRDIKSENILFDRRWKARLADFSLAVKDDALWRLELTVPAGTIGYLDPAYTSPSRLSTKSDVYSYGVVLLEIVSGRRAIDAECHPTSIIDWAVPMIEARRGAEVCDSRKELPPDLRLIVKRMLDIAVQCVSSEKERRPSMAEIVGELQGFVGQFSCPVSNGCRRICGCFCSWRSCTKSTDRLLANDDNDNDSRDDDGINNVY